jgi:hypothetical protein
MLKYIIIKSNNEKFSNYCVECFKLAEAALNHDARRHFSKDMFCQCGRGS